MALSPNLGVYPQILNWYGFNKSNVIELTPFYLILNELELRIGLMQTKDATHYSKRMFATHKSPLHKCNEP